MAETILGFDIGGSKIAVLEGDFDAQILARCELANGPGTPFQTIFEEMCNAGEQILSSARISSREPSAVSVSVGGPLDIEGGIILCPPNLPTWHGVNLKKMLSDRFGLPTFVEHDGNAGALAEYAFGAGQGKRNLIFLTAGTGLGAGIILDGRLYRGSSDTAGEVGHVRISDEGPMAYGKAGSWEGRCSAPALVSLASNRHPHLWNEETQASILIQAALEGMPEACEVVQEMGRWLGRGMAMLVDILNPDVIVVGTLGMLLGDLLLEPARRVVAEEALNLAVEACRIVPAALGDRLGDVAALMAALQELAPSKPTPGTPISAGIALTAQEALQLRQETVSQLGAMIDESCQRIIGCLRQGRKVLALGNGGSASQAQHLVAELVGKFAKVRPPLAAIALTADSIVGTCIGNDFGFEEIFARQVQALAGEGDVVVGLTTSGTSPNVVRALQAARVVGAATIALTGAEGMTGFAPDYELRVPSCSAARIQEEHLAIIHSWCERIDAALGAGAE